MGFKAPVLRNNYAIARTTRVKILAILTCSVVTMEMMGYVMPSEAIAQNWWLAQSSGTNYGLGLPKSASSGGGTRLVNPEIFDSVRGASRRPPKIRKPLLLQKQPLPLLTLLTPEDGAKTAVPQPTFYWYLNDQDTKSSSSAPDKLSNSFAGEILITTLQDDEQITLFETEIEIKRGLSSFKLPIAVSLKPSNTYRWQITLKEYKGEKVTASGWVVYVAPENDLTKSLSQAKNLRDRAKIYAQSGYWFDAIDGYTRWLKLSPNDLSARTSRNAILNAGFIANKNINFDAFIELL